MQGVIYLAIDQRGYYSLGCQNKNQLRAKGLNVPPGLAVVHSISSNNYQLGYQALCQNLASKFVGEGVLALSKRDVKAISKITNLDF